MTDGAMRAVERYQRMAPTVDALMAEATAVVPHRVSASDGTATIQVVLGRDRLPESMGVAADWRRRLGLERFASAVTQACRAAADERAAQWLQALEDRDWQSSFEEVRRHIDDGLDEDPAPSTRPEIHLPPPDITPSPPPRPMSVLAMETLQAVNALELPDQAPVEGDEDLAGSAARGNLILSFTPDGGVSCQVDVDWLARQEADDLTEALNRALMSARTLSRDRAAGPSFPTHVDELITEALEALRDPRSFA